MTNEMRQKLAREPFEEKIRKVAQLIRLTKATGGLREKRPAGSSEAPTPSSKPQLKNDEDRQR